MPLPEEEDAEFERLNKHADTLQKVLEGMYESEVIRTRDATGLVVEERFPDDYPARMKVLVDQLRAEREAIADYVRDHPRATPAPRPDVDPVR